ncbi:MAG TPA: hypothetical protein ENI53_01305 [Thermoplasmatales archaeon]|nr:hypothetical protein [Thermoplasmatales archaeon]
MKEIIVKTQKQFNNIKDQKETTIIKIKAKELIIIKKVPQNCVIEALGNSHVEAWDNSHVKALGNSHVKAWDNSHVEALGNSHVKALGNSHVEAWDNSHVEAWDNSHVEALDNSHVEALDNSHVEAYDWSYVVVFSEYATIKKFGDAIVRKQFNYPKNVKEWCKWYGIKINNGSVKLFKAVKEDYTDFYSRTIKYELGKIVKCPDWDKNYPYECGHGLHLSATPSTAILFVPFGEKYRLLECEVKLEDIKVYTDDKPDYPYKVRCKQVKVLRELT